MRFHPIAVAKTPFKEKFAIPRQPNLSPAAMGTIELLHPYNDTQALVGLEQVSHVWLLFQFHQVPDESDSPRLQVRPPRLGGNEKCGVFATRSTHRPNRIGQSVVRLDEVNGTQLLVSGVDLLDGTPILDIKPYVPYTDCVQEADNGLASSAPERIEVHWQASALADAKHHAERLQQPVQPLIEQCLAQDPKPAYQTPNADKLYGTVLWDLNVQWHYPQADCICVLSITRCSI